MDNLKYEAGIGDDIKQAIRESLDLSFNKSRVVEFNFNGVTMIVDYSIDNSETLMEIWRRKCKKRSDDYEASEEYQAAQVKRKIELTKRQCTLDALIENFPKSNNRSLILWLKEFAIEADHIDVSYDKAYVVKQLNLLGFESNAFVGYKGEWTTEKLVSYTVGQVLSCIDSMGSPHPITGKFCDDILDRNDPKYKEEVVF